MFLDHVAATLASHLRLASPVTRVYAFGPHPGRLLRRHGVTGFVCFLMLTFVIIIAKAEPVLPPIKLVPEERSDFDPADRRDDMPAPPRQSLEGRNAGHKFLDATGRAVRVLQNPRSALADFPTDQYGAVDWVRALRSGRIDPRASVEDGGSMEVLRKPIIMRDTKAMDWVRFPHGVHTQWLACSNCHNEIFPKKAGATPITMDRIWAGEACGVCHDKVAFSTLDCGRCHSVPPGSSSVQSDR